mmetsp:Transcript_3011/g.3729  ORF Transcript_3011/g.3729 Transcript_3011/m.3729 type:complete len:179 (-) Transcript_3011:587-1123(-)|eukprot:jgi/Bigna1/91775/estExt_fgenesh1_pg.C_1180025
MLWIPRDRAAILAEKERLALARKLGYKLNGTSSTDNSEDNNRSKDITLCSYEDTKHSRGSGFGRSVDAPCDSPSKDGGRKAYYRRGVASRSAGYNKSKNGMARYSNHQHHRSSPRDRMAIYNNNRPRHPNDKRSNSPYYRSFGGGSSKKRKGEIMTRRRAKNDGVCSANCSLLGCQTM